jgi:hypothetical protein
MPSRILGMKSPAELLLGKCDFKVPPKVFGCVCFVKDHRPTVGKLDPQATKCIFVGYASTQKGYKCWDPTGRMLFLSMDVTFREKEPYYTKKNDFDPFLEEFSSVTESDSREGENENGDVQHDDGVGVAREEVIVGTIPCPMNESVVHKMVASDAQENEEVAMGNDAQENEEVIVGTIPCPTKESENQGEKVHEK